MSVRNESKGLLAKSREKEPQKIRKKLHQRVIRGYTAAIKAHLDMHLDECMSARSARSHQIQVVVFDSIFTNMICKRESDISVMEPDLSIFHLI